MRTVDLPPLSAIIAPVARAYDFVMTHKLDADDLFIHRVQQYCAEARLNFFLIEPLWVAGFLDALVGRQLWPRVLLNMHSEHHDPHDIFHRVVQTASELGTHVIDPPDRAIAAFDKARLHPKLAAAGIDVPFTIIVPSAQLPGFKLIDDDREALGSPFVIKPAMGYGRKGVIVDAKDESDLARSAAGWPGGDYLLQRRIIPRDLDGS